jgi:hypothetical protein
MQSIISKIEHLIYKAGDLAETKAEILKLKAADKISETVAALFAIASIVLFLAVALIFVSTGAAIWIGQLLGQVSYGFLIVGGFYLFAGLLCWIFRNSWIKRPLSNFIVHKIAD